MLLEIQLLKKAEKKLQRKSKENCTEKKKAKEKEKAKEKVRKKDKKKKSNMLKLNLNSFSVPRKHARYAKDSCSFEG